jgi:hypothetical protein
LLTRTVSNLLIAGSGIVIGDRHGSQLILLCPFDQLLWTQRTIGRGGVTV